MDSKQNPPSGELIELLKSLESWFYGFARFASVTKSSMHETQTCYVSELLTIQTLIKHSRKLSKKIKAVREEMAPESEEETK